MRTTTIIFTILLILVSETGFSQTLITKEDARNVAQVFLAKRLSDKQAVTDAQAIKLADVTTFESDGIPAIYVFSGDANSFILISAEKALTPVLGYSFEGEFPAPGSNSNFESFLQTYIDQVKWARDNHVQATAEVAKEWDIYEGKQVDSPKETITVGPYVTSMWNQNNPYNEFCPADAAGPGGKVYAGCVATAMSIIMSYYRYPLTGNSQHSYFTDKYGVLRADYAATNYEWDAMQSKIDQSSGEGIVANATLQSQAGIAVNMGYAPDGSGAFSTDVPAALKEFFRYSSLAQYLDKKVYSDLTWESMLLEQLDASKPVYHSGRNSKNEGHAFVCDGYQQIETSLKFHFNFGWSGSANGYYTSKDVYGFSSGQGMVRNIFPTTNYPYGCTSKTLTYYKGSFEDGSGPLEPYKSNLACTWLIAPTDTVSSISLSFVKFSVDPSDTLFIYDGQDANATLLAKYTGLEGKLPATVSGKTKKMFVQFITNGDSEGDGWLAEYFSSSPRLCSGLKILTSPIGSISDGSQDYNYLNNALCIYNIQPPGASNITITFDEFDLEPKDFLYIIQPGVTLPIYQLTGKKIPDPIVIDANSVTIKFRTDAYTTAGGYKLNYSIGNVGNRKMEGIQSLSVSPNPASEYVLVRAVNLKSRPLTLTVNDMTGKTLYHELFNPGIGTFDKPINVRNFRPGMYFLTLKSSEGSITQKVIVRQ